jgi:hypothetical protein
MCGNPVNADEIEYELEFAQEADTGRINCHVHGLCFAAWELERRNGGNGTPAAGSHSTDNGSTPAPASALNATDSLLHASNLGTIPVRDDHLEQRGRQ